MRSLFVMLVFVFFTVSAFGQEISGRVKWRLDPILKVVDVNDKEKKELVAVIEKYQNNVAEIKKEKKSTMKTDLQKNTKQYLAGVRKVLGNERFRQWRQEVRRQNLEKQNQ